MEYRGTDGQMVIPIFYHVDPSIIRRQVGDFGKALEVTARRTHTDRDKQELLLAWRSVLTQAANLSGWDDSSF
ncbi:TMV resistance protein N, partial [Trifolium medium]|nr:TMV resistance protein N [Trifolium medium]